MKTRTKIAITIILALLYFIIQRSLPYSRSEEYDVTLAELQAAYSTYNITEFNGDLPSDTIVDFNEHDKDNMATTALLTDGKFHLSFNRKYVTGIRIMNMTMLHEMCHVKTWGDEHKLNWQGCMLDLDRTGAFREIIIDGYHEPEHRRNN